MGAKKEATVNDKIARLRSLFLEQIPLRMAQIEELWERARDGGDGQVLVELHRKLHSLKGTGRSFGFGSVGDAVEPIEAAIRKRQGMDRMIPPPPAWKEEMGGLFAALVETVASLQLPVNDGEAAYPGWLKEVRNEVAVGGKLVYLCDDEPLTMEHLSVQLACFGYETVLFASLKDLRAEVLHDPPDALIMDIQFPEGPYAGTETVRSLQGEAPHPFPVIFLSVLDEFDARLAAVQAGGEGYFVKPANIQEIVVSLDRLTCQQKPEPYRILIADDDPEVANYHSLILREAGMTTCIVNQPREILDALHDFRPDLVLLDIYMPDCSGHDLAKMVRQVPEYLGVPIIYLSAETDREMQVSAMRIGAEGFLAKPVAPGELVAAVEIRAERMRSLRSLMVRDSLTGLLNHTATTQLLEATLAGAKRHGRSICFAMLDIDHFKRVNDSYGHPTGDQVLLALARLLRERLRASDFIGRYGGEEFALILRDLDLVTSVKIVNELRENFARLRFRGGDAEFACTFSAGIAESVRFTNLETLREAADKALYRAKAAGRNLVVAA
jgi:diguanylate cyclase (GGDEF)-like protein